MVKIEAAEVNIYFKSHEKTTFPIMQLNNVLYDSVLNAPLFS